MNPTVSVVIPAYNQSAYLRESVESALRQTRSDIEILIIDDGSIDETPAVAADFGDAVRYFRRENGGLSAARNTGIGLAGGELLGFLDADDRWLPTFLERLVPLLLGDSGVDVAFSAWRCIDDAGAVLPEWGCYAGRGDLLDDLALANRFPPVATLARRDRVVAAGGFDEALRATEDWDLWLRLAGGGSHFDGVDEVLAEYRRHGDNMTLDVARMERNQLAVLDKLAGSPAALRVAGRLPQARARVCLASALSHHLQDDPEAAYRSFADGIQAWPALAWQADTWYRWVCADQPPGYRDTAEHKDLAVATSRVNGLLDRLFEDVDLAPVLAEHAQAARRAALLSLADHRYRAGDRRGSLGQLAGLVRHDPAALGDAALVELGAKAVVGPAAVRRLKRPATEVSR
jgi:hypothetical protein